MNCEHFDYVMPSNGLSNKDWIPIDIVQVCCKYRSTLRERYKGTGDGF